MVGRRRPPDDDPEYGFLTGGHPRRPFGLWVWGWGTDNTATFTANVSYGYPGGMNVKPINTVILKQ